MDIRRRAIAFRLTDNALRQGVNVWVSEGVPAVPELARDSLSK